MTTDQHLEKLTEAVAALTCAVEQLNEAWKSTYRSRLTGVEQDLRHVVEILDEINEVDDQPEQPIDVLDHRVVRGTVLPIPIKPKTYICGHCGATVLDGMYCRCITRGTFGG